MRVSLEAKIDSAKKVFFFMEDNSLIVKTEDIEIVSLGDTKKVIEVNYNYKNESIEVWKAYVKLINYSDRKKIKGYTFIVLSTVNSYKIEEAKSLIGFIREDIAKIEEAKKKEEEEEETKKKEEAKKEEAKKKGGRKKK